MKVICLDVYGTIALVDVEFDKHGVIKEHERWFGCSLCPKYAHAKSNVRTSSFLDGYQSYFHMGAHSIVCNIPRHPFRHALLPALHIYDEYKNNLYVAKINKETYILEPSTQEDVDKISEFVSDFEKRYNDGVPPTSYLGKCVVS